MSSTRDNMSDIDLFVATKSYKAENADEIDLHEGDVVEILDISDQNPAKKPRLDDDLDVASEGLLDTSLAKHKCSIRPKRTYSDPRQRNNPNIRWFVRVVHESTEMSEETREGWVPNGYLRPADEVFPGDTPPADASYRRLAVVRELIDTEEEFCRDLHNVLEKYYFPVAIHVRHPSQKSSAPKKPPRCVRDNHELIFGNLKQIADFHSNVLLEGVKYYGAEPAMLGRVFLRLERDFDKHVAYCRDEPLAQHFLQANLEARDYFEELSQKLCDDKTLPEHLKLPIQRINDYQLLIKELVKYTNWLQEDATYLQRALELMLNVPHRANDDKFTSNIEGYRGSIYKLGRLLAHDWYTVTYTVQSEELQKERYLFLFKARILVTKVKRISEDRSIFQLKDIIKLPEVQVRDVVEDPRRFELHSSQPGYPLTLIAHRDLVKLYWLDEIVQYSKDPAALEEHKVDDLQIEEKTEASSVTTTTAQRITTESYKTAENDVTVSDKFDRTLQETELSEAKTVIVQAKKAIVIPVEEPQQATQIQTTKTSKTESSVTEKKAEVKRSQFAESKESRIEIVDSNEIKAEKVESQIRDVQSKTETKSEIKSAVLSVSEVKSSEVKSSSVVVTQESLVGRVKEVESSQSQVKDVQRVENQTKVESLQSQVREVETSKSAVTKVESQVKEVISAKSETREVESSKNQAKEVESAKVQVESSKTEIKEVNSSKTNVKEVESTKAQIKEVEVTKAQVKDVETQKLKEVETKAQIKVESLTSQSKASDTAKTQAKESENLTTQSKEFYTPKTQPKEADNPKNPLKEAAENQTTQPKQPDSAKTQLKESETSKVQPTESKPASPESKSIETKTENKITESVLSATKLTSNVSEAKSSVETSDLKKLSETKDSAATRTTSTTKVDDKSKQDVEMSRSFRSSFSKAEFHEEISSTSITSTTIGGETISEVRTSGAVASSQEIRKDGQTVLSQSTYSEFGGNEANPPALGATSRAIIDDTISITSSQTTGQSGKASQQSSVKITDVTEEFITVEDGNVKTVRMNVAQNDHPIFNKTVKGVEISPGEDAVFECSLAKRSDVTWLKDNREFDAELNSRATQTKNDHGDHFKLTIKHCLESDSGTYSALALNADGKAACTAQLVVQHLSAEQREERSKTKAPVFDIKLKDTEILEGTYLRFMVRVKGDPAPDIRFFKDQKELTTDGKGTRIVNDFAEIGYYELIIEGVKEADAGVYICVATNEHGQARTEGTVKVTDSKDIFGELVEKGVLKPGEKPKFMWQRNGVYFEPDERFKVLMGEDQDSLALMFSHVRPEDAGLYTCCAQTSSGLISCSAELTVQGTVLPKEPTKPEVTFETKVVDATKGSSAMIEMQLKGFPKPAVTWTHDGKPIEAGAKYKLMYEEGEAYSLVIKNVEPEDRGVYKVIAKNDLGSDTNAVELNVKVPPKFKSKIEDITCQAGETIKIRMEIEGFPKPVVKVYKDGGEIEQTDRIVIENSEEIYILLIRDTKVSDGGSYAIVATNESAQASEYFKAKVLSPPVITQHMGETRVYNKSEIVSLDVKAEASPPATATWYKDDKEITSDTSSFKIIHEHNTYGIRITGVVTTDSAKYKCVLKNEYGTSEDTVRIQVKAPPTVKEKMGDVLVTEGDTNVELNLGVLGYPIPKAKWFLDGVEITSSREEFATDVDEAGNFKLIIKDAQSELAGQYKVHLSNEFGETETDARLTVKCKPKFVKSLTDTIVDEGATLTLQVEVDAYPQPEVTWYKNGTEVSTDTRIKITRDKQRNETYNLTVDLVKYEDGGEYEIKVQNVLGAVSCKNVVTVHKTENTNHENEQTNAESLSENIKKYDTLTYEIMDDANNVADKTQTVEVLEQQKYYNKVDGKFVEQTPEDFNKTEKIDKNPDERPILTGFVDDNLREMKKEKPQKTRLKANYSVEENAIEPKTAVVTDVKPEPENPESLTSNIPETKDIKDKSNKIPSRQNSENVENIDSEPQLPKVTRQQKLSTRSSTDEELQELNGGDVLGEPKKLRNFQLSPESSGVVIEELNSTPEVCSPFDENVDGSLEAPPKITDTDLSDSMSIYETQTITFFVKATGIPTPEGQWYFNGKKLVPNNNIVTSRETKLLFTEYKLEIISVDRVNDGVWELKVSNKLGEDERKGTLLVRSESELRRPTVTQALSNLEVLKKEEARFTAVLTADPIPDIAWVDKTGKILYEYENPNVRTSSELKDIHDNLKECTCTLLIKEALHDDQGPYALKAENKWGACETAASLDVLQKPEFENVKDVAVVPHEQAILSCNIYANPIPVVTWSKDDIIVTASDSYKIIEDLEQEKYTLIIESVNLSDEGKYTITASNTQGETTANVTLNTKILKPSFITKLSNVIINDMENVRLSVRCDGLPKPTTQWLKAGKPVVLDDRITATTNLETGQVTSELNINCFRNDDSAIYSCVATNIIGDATTAAHIGIAQTLPAFTKKLSIALEVKEGEPIELKTTVVGSPIPNVQWFKDGEPLKENDKRVKIIKQPDGTVKLFIEKAKPSDSGAYKLVITNQNGQTATLCAVAVEQKPTKPRFVHKLAEKVEIPAGQPLKLEAEVYAWPPPKMEWLKDGIPLKSSHVINLNKQPNGVITLDIDTTKPEHAGSYILILSNKLGEITCESEVTVTPESTRPRFSGDLMPQKVVEGFPAKLELKLFGHPQPHVTWTRNGCEIIPDDKHIKILQDQEGHCALLIDNCTPSDTGTYQIDARNENGEVFCRAPLTVTSKYHKNQPEERPIFIHGNILRDVVTDEGSPLVIDAQFRGNPIPSVIWSKDGKVLEPSSRWITTCDGSRVGLAINESEPSDAGTYSCKMYNNQGEDTAECKAIVRKVYQAPSFAQKFGNIQQLPTFNAKFLCRIMGIPQPDVTWYKDDDTAPLKESEKHHIKQDGDACCLYIRDCTWEDAGRYKCIASNREGTAECQGELKITEKVESSQKKEPPHFLKKIGDMELYRGMSAKFTACAAGFPEPEFQWYRNDEKMYPSDRIRMEKDQSGLLRLQISGVDTPDLGVYTLKIFNELGSEECQASLSFDSLDLAPKKPVSDQYSDFGKYKSTGAPLPLTDPPIISNMLDRHLTLSWKPSIPPGPRVPVTYQVEMLDLPNGEWRTVRSGIKSNVCGIPNLEPFNDYRFRVRVENKVGLSEPSPYAVTHRQRLEPELPKRSPYLPPGTCFSLDSSAYFPKDFDIERPLHGNIAQKPIFLSQEDDSQYGAKNHNVNLFWYVYGYPKPKISYTFNDEPIEMGGRFDCSYTRNGQASLFINRMLDRDVGVYEAIAQNEHGEARQRVRLLIAEAPRFTKRLDEQHILLRKQLRLEASVTGVPFPEVKWYKDWQPLAPSSRVKIQFYDNMCVLIINECICRDEGLYSLSARNVAGAVSSTAMIYVSETDGDFSFYNHTALMKPIRAKPKHFEDYYDFGDELGRGTQGITYHAVERLNGRTWAAKMMSTRIKEHKDMMYNEMDIMNLLSHRKLIRLHDAYEREQRLVLITELASGGELVKDNLLRKTFYTESEIAGYIRQLLQGLDYMHDKGIAHLGLTIGDLLISHPNSDDLKICDFGLARRTNLGKPHPLHYGMPEFCGPEVVNRDGVGLPADMWSVGIITYILLSGVSIFRGENDRDTIFRVRSGHWEFDEEYWRHISSEAKDFISKLLVATPEGRLDVRSALRHPWLLRADKSVVDEYEISSDRLRNYYNLYKEWYDNANCKEWYRRNKIVKAEDHPSRMIYSPGDDDEFKLPESSDRPPRKAGAWEARFAVRSDIDTEMGVISSESHYQNGPDTYLLQLRDVDFPVRLREYMKVAATRGSGYRPAMAETEYDWRTPVIHERRRFTDVMDEEIDDERKERIQQYGSPDIYSLRRLRHELGTRLDTYVEAEALIESKFSGSLPFFREKQQIVPIVENREADVVCYVVGEPTPLVQWFKNDSILGETRRIKMFTDADGRSVLRFSPASRYDVGLYKVVARNKVGQSVTRTRVVLGTTPDEPDSPTAAQVSDEEILLTWRQPKHDGYSPVLCYSLQYKPADDVEWIQCADNIDHEFYLIRNLKANTKYIFRLAARNAHGWGDFGVPTALIQTELSGAAKLELSRAMMHLQQITDSGRTVDAEEKARIDYAQELSPVQWDSQSNVSDQYNFISEIFRGRFSVVVKAINKRNDQIVNAKLIECSEATKANVDQEFENWRSLRHERITALVAAFRKPDTPIVALIMERLQGADVLTYLASRHEYNEHIVATLISQVLDGLHYLHWRGLTHLNIQPDNVVMTSVRCIQVKLVDFAQCRRVPKLGITINGHVDSHIEYTAPEILNQEHAFPQTDIWSVGVLTYVLLSGTSPFRGADRDETKQNISFVRYRFEHLYRELSQEAVRFVMLLFKRNPYKRPTAEECHENRWFMPSDYMIKKRERAVFLGNRLKEYSENYHAEKQKEAQQYSPSGSGPIGFLTRSNSIQEELLTSNC